MAKEDNRNIRIDSPYFSRAALAADAIVANNNPQTISEIASGVHSFGAYALTNEFEYQDEGIPFLRGTDYTGDFVNFVGVRRISPVAHQLLHKSEVFPGMVLLSMSGSVGSVAVALDSWNYPINSNQDIAKIIPSSVNPFYLAAFLSSSFGRTQINRLPVGSVQQHIFLWMIERIQVPRFSFSFEAAVARITQTAYESHEMVSQYFVEAEGTLLAAIGLADWTPPDRLSYTARASDAFTAGRLDAEHFHPKFAAALEYMHASGHEIQPLERLIEPIRNGVDLRDFVENGTAYIRVGDIKGGRIELERCKRVSATKGKVKQSIYLQEGDVLFTRKGSFGNAALVGHNDRHAIISTEIMLLRLHESIRRQINPAYLAAFFNSSMGQLQAERWAHGVAFYSVTQNDLYKFEIPLVDSGVQEQIAHILGDANRLRNESRRILEAAKRTVEIAIENGEAAAMAFLDQTEGSS